MFAWSDVCPGYDIPDKRVAYHRHQEGEQHGAGRGPVALFATCIFLVYALAMK